MSKPYFPIVLGLALAVLVGCNGGSNDDDDVVANDDDIDAPRYAEEFTAVDLAPDAAVPLKVAVRACAGLYNRRLGGSVYIRMEEHDANWLDELDLVPSEVVDAEEYLATCLTEFPSCVRYEYPAQQELMPSILTAGAALEAVPLAEGMDAECAETALDATVEFAERQTPELATRYVYENFIDQTTGMAMLSPGYDKHASNLSDPPIVGDPSTTLVDFVFSQKLFVHFLVNGCMPPHAENELLQEIVDNNPWDSPIGVYGYNSTWRIGGYLFEAQTRCLDSRKMGAIPTEVGNLSFFSTRRPPIEEPGVLVQNEPTVDEYDPAKTYVAFVVGDGDNVQYIFKKRNVWFRQRLAACAEEGNPCPPISWSISPHLPRIAPDIVEWYYAMSREYKTDYFTLPPSGYLYAYPASLNEQDQDQFVAATERDARTLDIHSVVHWEMNESWGSAVEHTIPKYASGDGQIQGVFAMGVPFVFPPFPDWPEDKFYEVLEGADGGHVAVFQQRSWRGVDNADDPRVEAEEFFRTPEQMAEELGGYPPGSVAWVYMTSDGGLTLENSFMELAKILPAHVQLVSADTAARFALEADRP